MRAFALSPSTTILVKEVKDGRWIDPLVMNLSADQNGQPLRLYSIVYPEAADPFNIPALSAHIIMGEYEISTELEKEALASLDTIKQQRSQIMAAKSGIIQATAAQISNIMKSRGN